MLDQYQYVTNGPLNTSIKEQLNWKTTKISESANVAHDEQANPRGGRLQNNVDRENALMPRTQNFYWRIQPFG
jgi:hypothetical protein